MPNTPNHSYSDDRALAGITAQQHDALDYLYMLHGNVPITLAMRADKTLVWRSDERAAVVNTAGNFLDPASQPEENAVTLAHADYVQDVQAWREQEARSN